MDGPLCSNCKYYIVSESENTCVSCGRPCGPNGVCKVCRVPYTKGWYVGPRKDALQRLVGLCKFERLQAAYRNLGDLLLSIVPDLPSNVIIVPVPTVGSHIRERGYDHMLLVARYFAKKRGLNMSQILKRSTHTKQRQASAGVRKAQAKTAFMVKGEIVKDAPYLLIDDVMTTGSTLKYAAKALRQAGASQVWVAVIARQTLD